MLKKFQVKPYLSNYTKSVTKYNLEKIKNTFPLLDDEVIEFYSFYSTIGYVLGPIVPPVEPDPPINNVNWNRNWSNTIGFDAGGGTTLLLKKESSDTPPFNFVGGTASLGTGTFYIKMTITALNNMKSPDTIENVFWGIGNTFQAVETTSGGPLTRTDLTYGKVGIAITTRGNIQDPDFSIQYCQLIPSETFFNFVSTTPFNYSGQTTSKALIKDLSNYPTGFTGLPWTFEMKRDSANKIYMRINVGSGLSAWVELFNLMPGVNPVGQMYFHCGSTFQFSSTAFPSLTTGQTAISITLN